MSNLISSDYYTLAQFLKLAEGKIQLADEAIQKIQTCRDYLDKKIQEPNTTYYGINTGFGSLCNVKINPQDIEQLQENLVLSHASGMGNEVPCELVRLMLLLKIKNFTYGNSGVSLDVVQRLIDMYNNEVYPVIYQLGSLGASGDLAPLAHLSLPLLGNGEVYFNNQKRTAHEILNLLEWKPLKLQSKEGLALLNGTQFMSAYAVASLQKIIKLVEWMHVISAMSLDAFDGSLQPFNVHIQDIRPHKGQQIVAEKMRTLLHQSELSNAPKKYIQDPYSFRCIPQVHGATLDAIEQIVRIIETELNSVTDNPLIFPEEDLILSGGNFHGQPLAIHLDFLAIAISELANISERRIYLLISGQRNLPPFLIKSAGLDSGFMIAQYTAASIVSKNKQLCTPASVDSIVSSNGQEDHVSMGANAAVKLWEVVQNVEMVLAIELMCAAQALDFRKPQCSSKTIERTLSHFRTTVPHLDKDRIIHDDITKTITFMNTFTLGEG